MAICLCAPDSTGLRRSVNQCQTIRTSQALTVPRTIPSSNNARPPVQLGDRARRSHFLGRNPVRHKVSLPLNAVRILRLRSRLCQVPRVRRTVMMRSPHLFCSAHEFHVRLTFQGRHQPGLGILDPRRLFQHACRGQPPGAETTVATGAR